jgi:hypothetical protein
MAPNGEQLKGKPYRGVMLLYFSSDANRVGAASSATQTGLPLMRKKPFNGATLGGWVVPSDGCESMPGIRRAP